MRFAVFYRVLITAVEKKTTQPKLHFFNNCFGDELSTRKFCVSKSILTLNSCTTIKSIVSLVTRIIMLICNLLNLQNPSGRLLATPLLPPCTSLNVTTMLMVGYLPTTLVNLRSQPSRSSIERGTASFALHAWCLWGLERTLLKTLGQWTPMRSCNLG